MKKVLLIGSELGKGGAERSISLLSYYLEQKYDVTLCILSGTDREQFYKTGNKVVFVDPPKADSTLQKIGAWRHRLRAVRELKRSLQIDVSISFLEGPDYVNVLTRERERVVLSIRGSKMHDKEIAGVKGRLRKQVLIPQLYRRADAIVCVTDALGDELYQHFGVARSKLHTIYNFYEIEEIRRKAAEPLTEQERALFAVPVIITSGRLHMAKEHDKLITILARLNKTRKARLLILGDGPLKKDFAALCEQLGLSWSDWQTSYQPGADVYFMGFQHNAFKYYEHASLFALPSSWEGFPNVLAEALICHKPVVSTDCPTGPREILDVKMPGPEPTTQVHRLSIGSLMPMLLVPTETVLGKWTEEINYWLDAEVPKAELFDTLTERFSLPVMLQQWSEIIEG
jgi:glycosyltransferase involved in cell wall biosynthesis